MVRGKLARDERGQAVTEYLLLLSILVTIFAMITATMGKMRWGDKIMAPLKGPFARAYQYGHKDAKGFDDGGPTMHPRANGDDSFRLFYFNSSGN